MAALIILMAEPPNSNLALPSSVKKYDVVEILPDGMNPGEQVCLPTFLVLRVPDKSTKELQYLKGPVMSTILNVVGNPTIKHLHRFYYDYDSSLPSGALSEIANYSDGWLVKDISLSDIKERE